MLFINQKYKPVVTKPVIEPADNKISFDQKNIIIKLKYVL